jgi:Response regulator containing CheY-like receiver, AAA-type ATPase, and DNA-binding domains
MLSLLVRLAQGLFPGMFGQPGPTKPQPRPTVIRRVAIVEDNGFQRDVLERLVVAAGYQCDVYASPQDALTGITRDPVDLLISDIFMPDLDGFELAARIRKLLPDLRCVLVTSHEADEIPPEKAATVDALLAKPITGRMLVDALTGIAR